MTSPIIIIGTGLSGYTTAREIRRLDETVPLVLITTDNGDSYSKPLLSNAYKNGKTATTLAMADAEAMREQLGAEIFTQTEVTAIDPDRHRVTTGDQTLQYSSLVLGCGANTIDIPVAGDAAGAVLSVNSLGDYGVFRAAMDGKKRLLIMGAGLIGCEFANDVQNADIAVDIVDLAPHPLGRLVPPEAGQLIRDRLAATGIRWHLATTVASVEHASGGLQVTLANATVIEVDVVLSAVGLRPALRLAEQASLEINRGIVTDHRLETSAADIYALGDCAEINGQVLPFVMPIMHGARALAKTLTGTPTEVQFPVMPVLVKTPAYPVVVAPPAPDVEGAWVVETIEGDIRALYKDADNKIRGFTLTGKRVSEKQALTKQTE